MIGSVTPEHQSQHTTKPRCRQMQPCDKDRQGHCLRSAVCSAVTKDSAWSSGSCACWCKTALQPLRRSRRPENEERTFWVQTLTSPARHSLVSAPPTQPSITGMRRSPGGDRRGACTDGRTNCNTNQRLFCLQGRSFNTISMRAGVGGGMHIAEGAGVSTSQPPKQASDVAEWHYAEDGEPARTDCSRYCSNKYNTGDPR